ncbi:poly [ADP-ribose] polymerase 11-like [Agrilus planipennis]|uniref:Poly [ADP-ribose] polymerase n=1 Tax=Agrilus planipennis TaxID=224129 RepID=A0A1W4X926_AGRPL|nr:poly [ADP-ribose] polymerase 11-like [Agrilus planipennis]
MGGLFSSPSHQFEVRDYYRPPSAATRNCNISQTNTESASLWSHSSSYLRPSVINNVANSNEYLSNTNTHQSSNLKLRPPPRLEPKLSTPRLKAPLLLSPKLPTPQVVKRNNSLFESLIKTEVHNLHWKPMDMNTTKLVDLVPHSTEYEEVSSKFYMYIKKKSRKNFYITKIVKIQNPYLLAAFQIKKEEIRTKFGHVNTMELFHGTKRGNVSSIRNENFNWRLHGKSLGHRFGKGVSFSPISFYSTHYCDKSNSVEKVMFLAFVLLAASCTGNEKTFLPPPTFDTTQKPNGDVIVKYEDNEFYPAYEIYFRELNYASNCIDLYDY